MSEVQFNIQPSFLSLTSRLHELVQQLKMQNKISESLEGGFVIAPPEFHSNPKIDLLILTVVHGNEFGSLVPVIELLQEMLACNLPPVAIGILICNPRAAELNVRFTERDLNRCFGVEENQSYEGQLAQKFEKIILRSRFLIDLHQTNYETKSDFFIFPENLSNISFASQLSNEVPIITHGLDFSSDGLTSDTFATIKGITSITYEMGQIGRTHEQAEKTLKLLKRAINIAQFGLQPQMTPPKIFKFGEKVTSSSQRRLIPNLTNLTAVKKGDVLGHDDVLGPIQAPHDGFILFPKYGDHAKKSSELCQLIIQN